VTADGAPHAQYVLQVGGTILAGGGANGDKLDQRLFNREFDIGGKRQPAFSLVAQDQFFQPRFVDRDDAVL